MFNLFSKKKQVIKDTEVNDEILAIISVLVEAAKIDEIFEEKGKNVISKIIQKQFAIKDVKIINETIEKINQSQNDSGDLVSHTKKIKDNWTLSKRKEIIEMLWKVCLVDNNLDPYEDMLIRKIAGLLYVETKDSNDAKQKVLKSLGK